MGTGSIWKYIYEAEATAIKTRSVAPIISETAQSFLNRLIFFISPCTNTLLLSIIFKHSLTFLHFDSLEKDLKGYK